MDFPVELSDLKKALVQWTNASRCLSIKRQSLSIERASLVVGLETLGFAQVGDGAFSIVLSRGAWVVKILNTRESPATLAYTRFCARRHAQNPFLPKIKTQRQVGRFTVVVSERLKHGMRATNVCRAIKNYLQGTHPDRKVPRFVSEPDRIYFLEAIAKISSILDQGHRRRPRCHWDITHNNVMFRVGDTSRHPVLNDPIGH